MFKAIIIYEQKFSFILKTDLPRRKFLVIKIIKNIAKNTAVKNMYEKV